VALPDTEGDVDRVGDREPVHGLKDERKVQALLQLDDHRAFVPSHRHYVARADFTLHCVTLILQEPLDRSIELDFRHRISSRRALLSLHVPHGAARAVEA
jgi:hypothetical protein